MSPGRIVMRLEELFERVWHHPDPRTRKIYTMTAFTKLGAAIDALTAENADLKQQLATAQSAPAGTSDDDLNGLEAKIEAALGHSVADPDATDPAKAPDSATGDPVVGDTSTTVKAPDGSTTTVDHATGTATTTDASGATVSTDPSAAAAATQAAQAAGVLQGAGT